MGGCAMLYSLDEREMQGLRNLHVAQGATYHADGDVFPGRAFSVQSRWGSLSHTQEHNNSHQTLPSPGLNTIAQSTMYYEQERISYTQYFQQMRM